MLTINIERSEEQEYKYSREDTNRLCCIHPSSVSPPQQLEDLIQSSVLQRPCLSRTLPKIRKHLMCAWRWSVLFQFSVVFSLCFLALVLGAAKCDASSQELFALQTPSCYLHKANGLATVACWRDVHVPLVNIIFSRYSTPCVQQYIWKCHNLHNRKDVLVPDKRWADVDVLSRSWNFPNWINTAQINRKCLFLL